MTTFKLLMILITLFLVGCGTTTSTELGFRDYETIIKDIDVTMNYAGSFIKEEIIDYLIANKGFPHKELISMHLDRLLTMMQMLNGIV